MLITGLKRSRNQHCMISTGRDLTLAPKQDGGPVNFLVYPYVEVDGKVWPQEKIQKKFSYQDE